MELVKNPGNKKACFIKIMGPIGLRKSRDLHFTWFVFCPFVCLSVSPSLPLVRFGQLLYYADKRIVNNNERNNLQVELI